MRMWIFGLLVLANAVFFAVMQWGGELMVDANNPPVQAELNADKLKLMSVPANSAPASAVAEVNPVAVSAVSAASPVVAASVPAPALHAATELAQPAKLACMEWGEFSGGDLQRAEKALAALKLEKHLKTRTVEYDNAYWVYIPPLKKHTLVEKKVAQLKSLDVDYFVIQEPGAWQNAISLGVFKTQEAAKKYLEELHVRGVKSGKVGSRASKLKFTIFVLNRLDSAMSSQVTALHKDFVDSELKTISCGG